MSKKVCSDQTAIARRSAGKSPKYYCKKCGESVVKDKWACKPRKLK